MILIALLTVVGIALLIGYNACVAEAIGEKVACGFGIFCFSILGVAAIYNDPLVKNQNVNYYLNHQDEFVVDTISVNGVITELKIQKQ